MAILVVAACLASCRAPPSPAASSSSPRAFPRASSATTSAVPYAPPPLLCLETPRPVLLPLIEFDSASLSKPAPSPSPRRPAPGAAPLRRLFLEPPQQADLRIRPRRRQALPPPPHQVPEPSGTQEPSSPMISSRSGRNPPAMTLPDRIPCCCRPCASSPDAGEPSPPPPLPVPDRRRPEPVAAFSFRTSRAARAPRVDFSCGPCRPRPNSRPSASPLMPVPRRPSSPAAPSLRCQLGRSPCVVSSG